MYSPAGSLDIEDNGMMHHAIYDSGGDNGVAKIITKVFEVDVSGEKCGALAVTAVYDLEEQRGVFCIVLLQPVKAHFIDEEDIWGGILSELSVEALISPACQQVRKHACCCGISAAIHLCTADK